MISRSRRLVRSAAAALLALAGASGCEAYGVQVQPLATSVQRPSNVAVYLQVRNSSTPVDHLTRGDFQISEDGQLLDPVQAGVTLLPDSLAAAHRVALLLDLTAAKSATDRQTLSQAAAGFVRKVETTEPVSVFAFDGSAKLYPVGEFAENPKADAPQKLGKLEAPASGNASRNLYGAMLQALAHLDARLAQSPKPVRVGTLVVFTAGPDVAGHATRSALQHALERTRDAVVAIGFQGQRGLSLDSIGRDGTVPMKSLGTAREAFELAAQRVQALEESRYLLAFCSPARGGVHEATVRVSVPGAHGAKQTADASFRYSASGFASGCNSATPPRFVVTLLATPSGNVPAPAPAGEMTETKPPKHHVKRRRATHAAPPHPAKPAPATDFQP